jgi:LytS/YehU family sensor histidine kinase
MRVYTAKIVGFLIGLLFGGTFASQIEILGLFIGIITVIEIFRVKGQLLKGPWAGFVFGILAGYFLHDLISKLPVLSH